MAISLSDLQRQIVDFEDGPLLVVAGPGAGKTRVLTERVRLLLEAPDANYRVLALTFTNKAAAEMQSRMTGAPRVRERSFIGTLHAFCMEVLANRGKPIGIGGLPNIFESFQDRREVLRDAVEADPVLRPALLESGDHRSVERRLSEWLQIISEFKSSLKTPDMVTKEFDQRLYEAYDAQLRSNDALDFDDLLLLTYRLFEENPAVSRFYRRQFRYICVDEAQDLNEAQYRVLCALCASEHTNIMMVGDPKQAIFTWNGADPKYLDLFVRDFGASKIELNENFRCSRSVVRAAQVMDPSYEVAGQLPIEGEVVLEQFPHEAAEAQFVLDTARDLLNSGHPDIEGEVSLDRIAVVGRTRFVFDDVARLLADEGVPHYKKMSAAAHEFSSDVVKEFQLCLRVVANPHDRLHLGMLVSRWDLPLEVESLRDRLRSSDALDVLAQVSATARSGEAGVVVEAARAATAGGIHLPAGIGVLDAHAATYDENARETVARDLAEWTGAWENFLRARPGGRTNLSTFLSHMALGTTEQEKKEGLALLTVHSAKGMEFDVVFLIGMSDGTFPDYRSTSGALLAEERRNAFVACTRSQRLLYVTCPRVKMMPWGDTRRVATSPFFDDLVNS